MKGNCEREDECEEGERGTAEGNGGVREIDSHSSPRRVQDHAARFGIAPPRPRNGDRRPARVVDDVPPGIEVVFLQ